MAQVGGMSWLVTQTWVLLLTAFVLGSAAARLAVKMFGPRSRGVR